MANSTEGFTFTWRIEDFSMLPHQKGEMLEGPSFKIDMLMNTKWSLRLYPRGMCNKDEPFIHCFLCRADFDSNPTPIRVGFSLTIESIDVPVISKTTGINFYMIDVKGLGFPLLNITNEIKHRYLSQDILTLTCNIWPSEEWDIFPTISNNLTKNCFVITRIKVQKRTCVWPITKINQLKEKEERSSLNLDSALDEASSMKLSFYLSENPEDLYAKIQICQINCPGIIKNRNFVKCKITVLCAEKEYQDSFEASHLFSLTQDEIWNFPEFIKKRNLVDDKYIYKDNTLFLQCEFSLSRKGSEYHLEVPRFISCDLQAKSSSDLSGSIQQLYDSRKFCDVSLCAGGRKFPFYKLILCARSPVFSAMFETDMKETNTGVVEITDMDSETTERMLTYMHSDTIMEEELSTEDICKLYSAADKYQIIPLKRECSLLLLSILSVTNVFDTLVIADRHQDNFLLTLVHTFLRDHSDEIFQSHEWRNFKKFNPELASEIVLNILKK